MSKKLIITDFIPVGHEYAVSRGYLVEVTHMTDREIRKQIETERLNGVPIINVGCGYYIADRNDPTDVLEVCDYLTMLKGRVSALNASYGVLTQWLSKVAVEHPFLKEEA